MEKEEKKALTGFGQVVIGPPASGKTTYCAGMQQFLHALKR
jgi:predicted PilT family ATPase